MQIIVGYALVVAFSAVIFFTFVYPEIQQTGDLWTTIANALGAH